MYNNVAYCIFCYFILKETDSPIPIFWGKVDLVNPKHKHQFQCTFALLWSIIIPNQEVLVSILYTSTVIVDTKCTSTSTRAVKVQGNADVLLCWWTSQLVRMMMSLNGLMMEKCILDCWINYTMKAIINYTYKKYYRLSISNPDVKLHCIAKPANNCSNPVWSYIDFIMTSLCWPSLFAATLIKILRLHNV